MKDKKLVIKAITLVIGGVAFIFFGTFIFAHGIADLFAEDNAQLRNMLWLMLFAFIGYVFSYFRTKEGGIILTFSGFLLGMNMFYYGGANDTTAALIYSLPFLIPGILLLLVGIKKEKS